MPKSRSTLLPASLASRPLRTIRPKDLIGVYAHPRPELARLAERGLLHRVANGYYVVIPQEQLGHRWLPDLEPTAAGIASAIFGPERAVLMGVSAARIHGAIPRALATAIVAVPKQHSRVSLTDRPATVLFVKRDTESLDAEKVETSLGPALVTTPEQTALDLSRRPLLGNAEVDVPSAIASLYDRSDRERLKHIAADQRLGAALQRVEIWASVQP
jgi:predicted transcriptional regulator of viral defense system